jgi:hypothetical protein
MKSQPHEPRPAAVCSALLAALEAAEGRRRARKRDQTPDSIGLAAKRELLQCIVREDPESESLEAWLLTYARGHENTARSAAVAATTRMVLEEWRLARTLPAFAEWLERGAPSDDATPG